MVPQHPTSFAAFHTHLRTVIHGLNALPFEESWEGHAQDYREAIQHLIDTLHHMLVDVGYILAPGKPDILGVFADELAHYTPRPNYERVRHQGDHRSYAVRLLYRDLTHLLSLERTWILRREYVMKMIADIATTNGYHKGRLVMVTRAIDKLI